MKAFSRLLGKTKEPPAGGLAPSTATAAISTVTAAATPTRATRSSTATKEGSTLADRAAELVPGADQTTSTTTTTTRTSKKRPFADIIDASTLAAEQSRSRNNPSSRSTTLPRSSSSSLSSAAQSSPEPSSSASETSTTPSDSNYQPFGCGPGTSLISESLVKPIVIATSPSPPPPSPPAPKASLAPIPPPTEAIPVPGLAGLSLNPPTAAAVAASSSSSSFADRYHPRHNRFALFEYHELRSELQTFDDDEMSSASMMDAMHFAADRSRHESFGGSKPISMMNNPHRDASGVRFRESLTGSHMAGTSISLSRTPFLGSSWVRDNVLPSASFTQHQSPSNHSSSYQPKLEANYLTNFLCCGKEIRNLHDLLQHYEDTHAGAAINGFSQFNGFPPQAPRPRPSASGLTPSDQFAGQSHLSPNNGLHPFSAAQQQQRSTSQISRDQRHLAMTANMDDMDTVGEMDMDEAVGHMELDDSLAGQRRARPIFGQQQHRSSLQMNGPSGLSQALRTPQPPTPGAPNFGLQHDPTASSVNTPAMTAQAQQQHQTQQQQLEQAFLQEAVANMGHNGAGAFGGMGMGNGFGNGLANFGNLNFAATALNNSSDFCINDPAKALFSPGNQHPGNNGNLFGDTPAGRNLQHQLMQSMNLSVQGLQSHPQKALLQQLGPMMLRDEDKPHKCPVVGCDKAYKNSNGLKYHKSHGHLNQQLHDNGDGTFSIINPETSTPYPGTEGMEKEKPFSCELCNKRYKNPNGLKYHRLHSDCNPELRIKKLQELQAAGLPAAMNLFPDGLVDGMPNGMSNGLDGGLGGGLDGNLASGLHTPMTEHMDEMDMSDIIAG